MRRLLVARLVHSLLVLAIVSVASFALARYAPGDPVAAIVGEEIRALSPVEQRRIRRHLGLDDPFLAQYGRWLANALRGDLGYSLVHRRPVALLLAKRMPATFLLMGLALALSISLGVLLGAFSAVRRGRPFDHVVTNVALAGHSIPQAWLGLVLVFVFAVALGWLPAGGLTSLGTVGAGSLEDRCLHLVLPVITLALTNLAVWVRYQRSSMIDALGRDFVRVARAKGLPERTVLVRHVWRTSLLPITTLLGGSMALLVEGAYVVESVFSWPGLGRLGVDAILRRDYPLVMGVAVMSAAVILIGNLLADMSYGWLDPRLRTSEAKPP